MMASSARLPLLRSYLLAGALTIVSLCLVKGLNLLAEAMKDRVGLGPVVVFILYVYGGTLLMALIPLEVAICVGVGFRNWLRQFRVRTAFAWLLTVGVGILHYGAVGWSLLVVNSWLRIHS